jgi:DNA repair photolyase
VSVTTLQRDLARRMEPRAAAPQRRLEVIRSLSAAGVPVTVLVAPLIPVLTDTELEDILGQAREAGARAAGYVLLRLPYELKDMFRAWLQVNEPLKASHVISRLQDTRGGKDYQAGVRYVRMRGTGEYADLIAQRFRLHAKKLGYGELPELDCSQFRKPATGPQMSLF